MSNDIVCEVTDNDTLGISGKNCVQHCEGSSAQGGLAMENILRGMVDEQQTHLRRDSCRQVVRFSKTLQAT